MLPGWVQPGRIQGQPLTRLAFLFSGRLKNNFRTALNGLLETVVLYL
jgi:hypothetical protein